METRNMNRFKLSDPDFVRDTIPESHETLRTFGADLDRALFAGDSYDLWALRAARDIYI